MITNTQFKTKTEALGRNGMMIVTGLDVSSVEGRGYLSIRPITSKGLLGRCLIELPTEAIPTIIADFGCHAGGQACYFVTMSSLVPKSWVDWFYTAISDNAPFSWGDNNRSLVTASSLADHCENRLESGSDTTSQSNITKFLNKLRALGETYVDLEN